MLSHITVNTNGGVMTDLGARMSRSSWAPKARETRNCESACTGTMKFGFHPNLLIEPATVESI